MVLDGCVTNYHPGDFPSFFNSEFPPAAGRGPGRGGWTWYTGSASWYYRALTETILGLKRHGSFVTFKPVLTSKLNRFSLRYRFGRSTYVFQFRNPRGLTKGRYLLTIDEKALDGTTIALEDDGRVHQVAIDVAPLEEPEIQL